MLPHFRLAFCHLMLIGMVEFFPMIDPVASLRIIEPNGSSAKGELIASEPAGEIKVSFDKRRLFFITEHRSGHDFPAGDVYGGRFIPVSQYDFVCA